MYLVRPGLPTLPYLSALRSVHLTLSRPHRRAGFLAWFAAHANLTQIHPSFIAFDGRHTTVLPGRDIWARHCHPLPSALNCEACHLLADDLTKCPAVLPVRFQLCSWVLAVLSPGVPVLRMWGTPSRLALSRVIRSHVNFPPRVSFSCNCCSGPYLVSRCPTSTTAVAVGTLIAVRLNRP